MRDIKSIEAAKAALNATKTAEAVLSLPPGFIVGFRLRTENNQMIVGKGVMNCRGKRTTLVSERIIAGEEYLSPSNIIRGVTYYVYMNSSKEIKVDSIGEVWDDGQFGYYHPTLYQYRFLGQFDIAADGTYENIINQDPVLGNDIDADQIFARHLTVGSVEHEHLADDAVDTNNIIDYAITSALIAADAVLQAHLADNSVGSDQLITGAVTNTKIGTGAVSKAKILAAAVSEAKLATNAVTTTKINDAAVSTAKIIARNITSGLINTEAILAEHISAAVISVLLLKANLVYIGHTGTYGSEVAGDRVLYIDGDELSIQEWTNGVWSTVKGIKIGGAIAGLFLNMIGCGGIYNPNNPPTSVERFPNPYFRVFNFESTYADQNGLDDWTYKTNCVTTLITAKFGTRSLRSDPAGTGGLLASPAGGTVGSSQSYGSWIYFTRSGTATSSDELSVISLYSTNNYLRIYQIFTNGSSSTQLNIRIGKNASIVYNSNLCTCPTGWNYIAVSYNSVTDIAYVTVNGTIYSTGVLGGTWGSGTFTYFVAYPAYDLVYLGLTLRVFFDEIIWSWDHYVSPEIWAQHYTHNVAWDTDTAAADQLIRPDTDGRVMALRQAGDTKQMLTGVPLADPTAGWFASKTSGWTADSFSAGLSVDFSSVVSVGTKSIIVSVYITTASGHLYTRPGSDSTFCSNTPNANSEYFAAIAFTQGRYQVEVRLNDLYVAEFAVSDTSSDVYVSYPLKEFR